MPIQIAEDNHLAELHKLRKADLEYAVFETLAEFEESIKSSAFSSDESGYWACVDKFGNKYSGDSVEFHEEKPEWATHVYWYGK